MSTAKIRSTLTMNEVRELKLEHVTKVVSALTPEFDRDGISARVAKREGRSQSEVLADWDAKGKAGMARGNAVHEYAEYLLGGKVRHEIASGGGEAIERPAELSALDDWWGQFGSQLRLVDREVMLTCEELGFFGFADYVFEGDRLVVYDLKAKLLTTDNKFDRMLCPLGSLEASDLAKASVQITLYRLAIAAKLGIPSSDIDGAVLALSGRSWRVLRAIPLENALTPWLRERYAQRLAE